MPNIEYKIYFDNQPAAKDVLDRIDEIVVEQQINMMWEARLKVPVCVDEKGKWESEDLPWLKEFTRVRVAIRVGDGDFVPLIEGRIKEPEQNMNPTPGNSIVTVVVRDDTWLLHTASDEVESYPTGTDSDIASQIFQEVLGTSPQVDPTSAQPDNPAQFNMRRGSKMQFLRVLARRHENYYAYVLPGENPGESIGCFKKLPEETDGLPALYLLGEDRNMRDIRFRNNGSAPSKVTASALSLRDKQVTSHTASYNDETPPKGETATQATGENLTTRRLPPGRSDTVSLESAVSGAAQTSAYSIEATGSTLPLCYSGVLTPYRMVPVRVSDSRYSTDYVIFKVTHTLTRSHYTQSFTLRGKAVSEKKGASATSPAASASASVSFNIQVSIF